MTYKPYRLVDLGQVKADKFEVRIFIINIFSFLETPVVDLFRIAEEG